jgi:hypothetical protein
MLTEIIAVLVALNLICFILYLIVEPADVFEEYDDDDQ